MGGAYAAINSNGGSPATYTIIVYPATIRGTLVRSKTSLSKYKGFLAAAFLHELGHKCLQDNGGADDSPEGSCSHLAIVYGSTVQTCELVEDL
jgi:hypothetical protein